MQRLIALVCAVLFASSCQRKISPKDIVVENDAELAASFGMGDPPAASQLLHGFYSLEGGKWRWTGGSFAVALPDPRAGQKLELRFLLPEPVVSQLGPVTVSATLNGHALPPEVFATQGEHSYVRDLPPDSPGRGPLVIEFHADKTLPADGRELSLIATRVGLTPP